MNSLAMKNAYIRTFRYYSNTIIKSTNKNGSQLIFDRELKCRQRGNSINALDSGDYDYLRQELSNRLVDRIDDITKSFPVGLDISCHKGFILDALLQKESLLRSNYCTGGVETLVQCDMSEEAIGSIESHLLKNKANSTDGHGNWTSSNSISEEDEYIPVEETDRPRNTIKTHTLVADEEDLPFEPHSYDIIFCSLGLHWVNDISKTLAKIRDMLKPDGVFIGCLLGGETLWELKRSFYLAELERKGGLSYHVSPMIKPSDVAGLLQSAGFSLPTIDVDTIQIGYPNAVVLMEHLKGMGESTAFIHRQYNVGLDTMLGMSSVYQHTYGLDDGTVPATFQVIYMIGWSPHSSQQQPLQRGCGQKSLVDELAAKEK